ncbi:hypothetical protein [Aporhodopirellula aestuarii]|uniref:Uncharacterized protein n=1 Tax=Aporhodopirellula aestuarii TaxID=2950107 RepID=A0ABT0U5Y6_9BACT|nr:hypothetical protein [Aporhodopirellula aestuarii]MCM2371950.1 hypothetical protein [Aporhodopirellula aestuarii]
MWIRSWMLIVLVCCSMQLARGQEEEVVEVIEADIEAAVEAVVVEEFLAVPPAAAPKNAKPLTFMKPLFNLEISFINRVCDPTDDQMKEIVKAATVAYQATGDMVKDAGGAQIQIRANEIQVRGPRNEHLSVNPYARVRDDARAFLKPILSEQQFDTYVKEADARDHFERATVVGIAIGMLDAKVGLSETQYAELTDLMMEGWTAIDLQSMMSYMHNEQYLPPIPSEMLKKVLSAKQKKVVDSTQQINLTVHFGNQFGANADFDEEWIK